MSSEPATREYNHAAVQAALDRHEDDGRVSTAVAMTDVRIVMAAIARVRLMDHGCFVLAFIAFMVGLLGLDPLSAPPNNGWVALACLAFIAALVALFSVAMTCGFSWIRNRLTPAQRDLFDKLQKG